MNITLTALLFDQFGRVLLTEDPATDTLVPPSVALPVGTAPIDALSQAIRETTGLIALPVRLCGLYPGPAGLTLSFRAIQRGGAIRQDDGRPAAGLFEAIPTPEPMGPVARQQLGDALHHTGGPPVAAPEATSVIGRLQRALSPGVAPGGGPWSVMATLVLVDGEGRVGWWQDGAAYRLPETAVAAGELPDVAAARLARPLGPSGAPVLRAVFVAPARPTMYFAYGLSAEGVQDAVWARPSDEPDSAQADHVALVAAAPATGDSRADVVVALLPAA